jgi:hypothetical protein
MLATSHVNSTGVLLADTAMFSLASRRSASLLPSSVSLPAPPSTVIWMSAARFPVAAKLSSPPLAPTKSFSEVPTSIANGAGLKTWIRVVLATVGVPPTTETAPLLTRIFAAASRLIWIVLSSESPGDAQRAGAGRGRCGWVPHGTAVPSVFLGRSDVVAPLGQGPRHRDPSSVIVAVRKASTGSSQRLPWAVLSSRLVVRPKGPLVYRSRTFAVLGVAVALVCATPAPVSAQDGPGAGGDNASCMGLGSSFYGQFAPQQRAFVALFVQELEGVPGQYYVRFAQEKEGGTIPAPCGTRLE